MRKLKSELQYKQMTCCYKLYPYRFAYWLQYAIYYVYKL